MLRAIKRRLRHARDFAQYQAAELTGRRGERFEGHYAVWRSRRIATILDGYPPRFFDGKTLLELGAGFGAIGAMFGALGAKVTCLEGREQNVQIIRQRYPFVATARQDLNEGLPGSDQYDVIVHLGVLYHLAHPENALRDACRRCRHLILETEVTDSNDAQLVRHVEEHAYIYDQALDGVGSRPSPAFVERVLGEEDFKFRRLDDARCNWELHEYDWPLQNTGEFRNGRRRMWFAEKTS